MAAIASPRSNRGPIHQLTPPSSSHGKGGLWDFAVPVKDSSLSHEPEPYMSDHVASAHSPRQPLTSQANGFAKPVYSSNWDSQDQYYENNQQYLVSDRVNELHRKPSGDMSASNSEQDSVLEYYKRNTANRKGPLAAKGKAKKKPAKPGPTDPNWVAIEHDQNNWIHRDKLKEIETRELEEAGFRVGHGSRSNSRSQIDTRKSRDRNNSDTNDVTQNGEDRHEPRKAVSPIPAEDEEPLEEYETWSSSPTEEVAPEIQPAARMNHTVRPSTSRIPLPKTSGIPVPSSGADRDPPQPRSRAGSTTWNGEAGVFHSRGRSGSAGSQALFDETGNSRETTPPQGHMRKVSSGSGSPPKYAHQSPKKGKTPSKPIPSSGARKTSAQKPQPKTRNAPTASPPKRSGTSGGSASRPTTSSRPEGEAPWIATMYKPDPRLPPDQQIIPTHAKRMQQELWETEGKRGSMYDRDFRLLNDDMSDKRLSQNQEMSAENQNDSEPWPLTNPAKQPSSLEKGDRNATTSPNFELGGYKLTPTISHPRAPSPKMAPPIAPAQPKPSTTRIPESKEEEIEPKKGCCCIVM